VSGFLLDTNVLSENLRKTPHARVAAMLTDLPAHLQFVSVLTLGEIRRGIETTPEEHRRIRFAHWLETTLPERYGANILPVDAHVADLWGRMQAAMSREGKTIAAVDGLLAATAIAHDLTLVTRNVRDFLGTGVPLINPWTA